MPIGDERIGDVRIGDIVVPTENIQKTLMGGKLLDGVFTLN